MIDKSFIIAFHKTLAAPDWKSQSTELRNSQAQLLRVFPSCLLSKRLVHTLSPGELSWPFAFADRRFLCTKHSLFLRCGSQPSHKVGFCSSWADQGWWASCVAYPYGVLPSPHLWQALHQLQQATKVRKSAGLLNFKILRLYARNLVLSLSLTDSAWLALTASLFFPQQSEAQLGEREAQSQQWRWPRWEGIKGWDPEPGGLQRDLPAQECDLSVPGFIVLLSVWIRAVGTKLVQ